MRFLRFALILLTFLRAVNAANTDPMAWVPPTSAPKPVLLVQLDDKEMAGALQRANAIFKTRSLKPELGLEVTNVMPRGPAAKLGIKPGDIFTALDGTPLIEVGLFNNFRDEKTQKLTIFDSSNTSKTIEIGPGKLGAMLRPFDRENPLALPGKLDDLRWKTEVFVAGMLNEIDPKLAASALARAVLKGMPRSAAVDSQLGRLYLDAFSYDDAMNFAHWALKENPKDDSAIMVFARAAAYNYKLEAYLNFIKRTPVLVPRFNAEQIAALEKLISDHKAKPDVARLVPPPGEAMKSMFWDDLSTRAEMIQGAEWVAKHPQDQITVDSILQCQRITVRLPARKGYCFGFTPAVKNIYVKAVVVAAPNPSGDLGLALFRLGLFPLDQNADGNIEELANPKRGFSICSLLDCDTYVRTTHTSGVLDREVMFESPQIKKQINDRTADIELEIILLNGDLEMRANGNRIFYGPLGQSDLKLFASFMYGGVDGRIKKFQAYELMTPTERDELVKPNINRQYTHGRTRLQSVALHGTKAQIRELVKMGAKLDIKDEYGLAPLNAAILQFGDFNELSALGAKADLYALCGMNDVPKALAAIAAAPPPPAAEPITPLHYAATTDNIEVAKKLLEKGYKINAISSIVYVDGTPLHWAAFHGRERMVEFLLKNGADPNAEADSYTPIQEARDSGFESIAKLMENSAAAKRANQK